MFYLEEMGTAAGSLPRTTASQPLDRRTIYSSTALHIKGYMCINGYISRPLTYIHDIIPLLRLSENWSMYINEST